MGKKLTALDMAFLVLETQRTPVNVAGLQIYAHPKDHPGHFVREMLDELEEIEAGPPFNMKLGHDGLLRAPSWVVDEDFDLDYHIRHSALPPPGDMAQLLKLVSRLHSRVMDRDRPLWEFHLIEGLSENRFAVYIKMHHAMIDGMAGVALLEACLSRDPADAADAPWRGERRQQARGSPEGALDGLLGLARKAVNQLGAVPDLGKLYGSHLLKAVGLKSAESPAIFTAPKSMFNAQITGARRLALRSIPLADIKQVATAAEVTVNDVVLAVCGGALRRYMLDNKALPRKSLVATVPMSVRTADGIGNQITYVGASLATNRRKPVRRLQSIHESMQQSKSEMTEVSASAATTFAVAAQGIVALLNRVRVAGRIPPPANLVISNVPGPRQALYFGGARLLANYPLSVLVDGQALNITVQSYCGSADFGLMACRETVPDLERLADYLLDEMATLQSATSGLEPGGKAARGKRTPRKKKKTVRKKTAGKKRALKKTAKKRAS